MAQLNASLYVAPVISQIYGKWAYLGERFRVLCPELISSWGLTENKMSYHFCRLRTFIFQNVMSQSNFSSELQNFFTI